MTATPVAVAPAAYINSSAVHSAANRAVAAAIAASGATAGFLPVFTDTSGDLGNAVIAQSGNFVGIGTANPAAALDIVGTNPTLRIDNFSNTLGDSPNFNFISARGTSTTPLATQSGDNLGQFASAGYNGTAFPNGKVNLGFIATENWSATSNGTAITFATTANGTTSRAERLRIDNTGNVGIGTTTPAYPLTVNGVIQSTTGGFIFPDGSTQGAAAGVACPGGTAAGTVCAAVVTAPALINTSYPTIDASYGFSGADECADIALAWQFAVDKGYHGAIIDARGFHGRHTCNTAFFTNYPYTPGVSPTFTGGIDFGPDNIIVTNVQQYVPAAAYIDGHSGVKIVSSACTYGFCIQTGPNFPTGTAVLTMGAAHGAYTSGTGVPHGVQIRNLNIACNGVAGSTALLNEYSQEGSGIQHVLSTGCTHGLQIVSAGPAYGAINSGPYIDFTYDAIGVNDAAATCIDIIAWELHGLLGLSCAMTGDAVQAKVGINVNGGPYVLSGADVEGPIVGIEVGALATVISISLQGVQFVSNPTHPMTSGIDISNAHEICSLDISGASIGGYDFTNLLKDNTISGANTVTSGGLAHYSNEQSGASITSASKQIPTSSVLIPAIAVISETASFDVPSTAPVGQVYEVNCSSPCTATLPSGSPGLTNGWYQTFISYGAGALTINSNGMQLSGSTGCYVLRGGAGKGVSATVYASPSNGYYLAAGSFSSTLVAKISGGSIAVAAGSSGNHLLVLTGSDFLTDSTVEWNGASLTTTYVSPQQISAVIPASDYSSLPAQVTVMNPAGTSLSFELP